MASRISVGPLQERVERLAGTTFNSCLLNLYRDGKDSLSWHSDNEKPYGLMPKIGESHDTCVTQDHVDIALSFYLAIAW